MRILLLLSFSIISAVSFASTNRYKNMDEMFSSFKPMISTAKDKFANLESLKPIEFEARNSVKHSFCLQLMKKADVHTGTLSNFSSQAILRRFDMCGDENSKYPTRTLYYDGVNIKSEMGNQIASVFTIHNYYFKSSKVELTHVLFDKDFRLLEVHIHDQFQENQKYVSVFGLTPEGNWQGKFEFYTGKFRNGKSPLNSKKWFVNSENFFSDFYEVNENHPDDFKETFRYKKTTKRDWLKFHQIATIGPLYEYDYQEKQDRFQYDPLNYEGIEHRVDRYKGTKIECLYGLVLERDNPFQIKSEERHISADNPFCSNY